MSKEYILSENLANALYKILQEVYEKQGASEVIKMGSEFQLNFEKCIPCDAEMPFIKTTKDQYCAVCGS